MGMRDDRNQIDDWRAGRKDYSERGARFERLPEDTGEKYATPAQWVPPSERDKWQGNPEAEEAAAKHAADPDTQALRDAAEREAEKVKDLAWDKRPGIVRQPDVVVQKGKNFTVIRQGDGTIRTDHGQTPSDAVEEVKTKTDRESKQ